MGSAVSAIFTADGRPMEAEVGRMEAIGQKFTKSFQQQKQAELSAEIAALDARVAAHRKANEEIYRLEQAAAIRAQAGGLLDKRNAYLRKKALIMGTTGSGMAPGFAKLLATESVVLSAPMAAGAATGFWSNFAKNLQGHGSGGMSQLVHVFRATFDSLASGMSPWRVLLQQGPQAIQAFTAMAGSSILKLIFKLGVVGASIGAIVGSFFIWRHRVKSLTDELTSLSRVDVPALDVARLSSAEQGWLKIRDAIAAASDEINSANHRFNTMMKFLDEAQRTEKQLLENRKRQALLQSGNDPVVRARFLKEEHDLEKRQMEERLAADKKHIEDLQKEQDEKLAAANAIKVTTEQDEKFKEESLKKQVEMNNLRDKDKTGKEIAGTSAIEKAQAVIDSLTAKAAQHRFVSQGPGLPPIDLGATPLSETDSARLATARGIVEQGRSDQAKLTEFERTKKERDQLRAEQKRLFDEAAAAGADKIKAAKAYNEALALNSKILADNDKLRALEETTGSSSSRQTMQLNALQRIGAYAATPPDWKLHTEYLRNISQNSNQWRFQRNSAPKATPVHFGGKGTTSTH